MKDFPYIGYLYDNSYDERIEMLKANNLRYDPDDAYISMKYGSTNNKMDLVDKELLKDKIAEKQELYSAPYKSIGAPHKI